MPCVKDGWIDGTCEMAGSLSERSIDSFRDTSFVYSRDLPPDFLEARTP